MSNTRSYDKVDDGNVEVWKPNQMENGQPVPIDPNNPPFIEGYYSTVKHGVGKHNSTVYNIHTVDANGGLVKVVALWGSAVVDGKMKDISLNSFVKIQYNGRIYKKEVPPTQPNGQKTFMTGDNSFNSWDVFVWKDAPSYASLMSGQPQPVATPQKEVAPYPGPVVTPSIAGITTQEPGAHRMESDDLPF